MGKADMSATPLTFGILVHEIKSREALELKPVGSNLFRLLLRRQPIIKLDRIFADYLAVSSSKFLTAPDIYIASETGQNS
jgi:hypothetical protein